MQLMCLSCGGALAPEAARGAVTCRFCGVTSAPPEIVVVGRLKPMDAVREPDLRLPCPRCADYLTETRVQGSVLSACKGCGGVWLDAATIARLKGARDHEIDRAAQRIAARVLTGAPPDRTLSITCPVCRKSLRRMDIPETSQSVDVCDAHGTWFDRAEADELQLFVTAFEDIRESGSAAGDVPATGAKRGFFAKLFG